MGLFKSDGSAVDNDFFGSRSLGTKDEGIELWSTASAYSTTERVQTLKELLEAATAGSTDGLGEVDLGFHYGSAVTAAAGTVHISVDYVV